MASIVFLAAAISSIAGFAFSAIAAPPLLLVIVDNVEAVQVLLVSSIALQTYSVISLWQHVSARSLIPYLWGGVLTLPLGLYLLLTTPLQLYLLICGLFLLAYSVYAFFRPSRIFLRAGTKGAGPILVGALGGITGPIAAFPGAFITIWCSMLGWEKERQRGLYQPYILAMQVFALIGLWVIVPPSAGSISLVQYALPAMIGAFLGLRIFNSLTTTAFNKIVCLFLFFAGAGLALKSL